MTLTRDKPKRRLLAVEDNAPLLEAIAVCLEHEGYEVMTARSGEDAFVRVAETIPDLIVSDVMMPRGDGFSLVKNLRSNPRTELIPIVFLTAKDGRNNRLNGVRAGVDAYLTKPFEPEELILTIENILNRVKRTQTRGALNANSQTGKPSEDYQTTNDGNPPDLSEAEVRIAALVAEFLSNKEIAVRCDLSIRTVESHVSRILAKKDFANRVELACYINQQNAA
ncbi:MAG: response regulator transcription factor [Acidobacteriota bacterium]|nr:response regulator transcription factor [Acidobacteriota bacterium]